MVVNEKAFRFSTLPFDASLLSERSGYGPFTSRLALHQIDLAIAAAGPEGIPLSYHLPSSPPELVEDYFAWLGSSFGIHPEDEVRISLYAHASNGGIRIDQSTACVGGPKGLFACGECSGGMHGADRIGGLASAAALVFGRQAGRHAAQEAACEHSVGGVKEQVYPGSPDVDQALSELRHTTSAQAMVGRTSKGLTSALATINALDNQLSSTSTTKSTPKQGVLTTRTHHQLMSAQAMVEAMLQRQESCCSHHRVDT